MNITELQIRVIVESQGYPEFCPICGLIKDFKKQMFCSMKCYRLWQKIDAGQRHSKKSEKISKREWTPASYQHLWDRLHEGVDVFAIAKETNRSIESVMKAKKLVTKIGQEGIARMDREIYAGKLSNYEQNFSEGFCNYCESFIEDGLCSCSRWEYMEIQDGWKRLEQ